MSQAKKPWKADPTGLGIVSQVWGDVAPAGLASALELQAKEPQKKLGQAMLECGAVKPQQLTRILQKQEEMRHGKSSKKDVNRLMDFATHRTRQAASALDKLTQTLWGVR